MSSEKVAYVIDVDSGNLQSLQNAIEHIGYQVKYLTNGEELMDLIDNNNDPNTKLILPGVGNYGHFVKQVNEKGLREPILKYIASGKPLFGICVGLQTLLESSTEDNNVSEGLGYVEGLSLTKFKNSTKSVPHIGWNNTAGLYIQGIAKNEASEYELYGLNANQRYYFVHSYAAIIDDEKIEKLLSQGFNLSIGKYGDEKFVAAISKDNVFATQFHPEKSGKAGIKIIKSFLNGEKLTKLDAKPSEAPVKKNISGLTHRIIACLDVRTNDDGDLVVTKGDQYDVREKSTDGKSDVRNLGKPVELAENYYKQGADEVTFLNITSFKNCPLQDLPMLEVLKQSSKTVFVPLTVGGGIRDFKQPDGEVVSALKVAEMYFKSGADKVSIGSDAVYTAEQYYDDNEVPSGKSPIEMISKSYGNQAVVISVDPKRSYVADPKSMPFKCFKTKYPGPKGEEYCYYQVSVKGGREFSKKVGAFELVTCCEKLGAGEILLNCIDKDGAKNGYDLELVDFIKKSVNIPVIASSGAGKPEHFLEVFRETGVDAALGAGMFHREEYKVMDVKNYLDNSGYAVRFDIDG
ncbi:imidazoleglycerol-phosphate synthase [Saccharomycopsis crataegensis]|uniref:Imidazole glycerol phosphate synthase hisHF n=1 Tax=Saccharomycopsis crataegensis TaxID=43959 RepID=A0AAV5QLP2_9ASCO|nr:imidazoleglycerol-phosphate synthase [Saccharomycopsis crataegensis]